MKIRIVLIAICLLIPFSIRAQFYYTGDNPWSLKWQKLETPNFRIIYPQGMDSLAIVYGKTLEQYRIPDSRSLGMVPGSLQWSKTPVVMHAFYGLANGSVTWAPKRMDLYTVQEPYSPDSSPWVSNLIVHETRHLGQLQFGYRRPFKGINFVLGEMATGAFAGLYPNLAILEGDAVVAETALSHSGRGRNADFMNYYRMAFDAGDYRNWWQWRYGSQRRYAPNHYALGYLTIAGMRYAYDDTLFTKQYFDYVVSHPLHIGDMQKTIKKGSGVKFKKAFLNIQKTFHSIWAEDEALRAPFIDSIPAIPVPKRFTNYYGNEYAADGLYSVKSGMASSSHLVRIHEDGTEDNLGPFYSYGSPLRHVGDTLYWSEYKPDPRWSMRSFSILKGRVVSTGRTFNIGNKKSRYYSPAASTEGDLSVTEYPFKGGSRLLVMDPRNGSIKKTFQAPDSLQIVESCWIGRDIYFSGVSRCGFGIYKLYNEVVEPVLSPSHVSLRNLKSLGSLITFTCDRTGTDEIYSFDTKTLVLKQLTNTRYGAEDYSFNQAADTLYYSSLTSKGKTLFKIPTASLIGRNVSFADVHKYIVAEKLAEQESALAQSAGEDIVSQTPEMQPIVGRYRKGAHMFNFHSWAPIYVNVDKVQGESYDYNYEEASIGATGLFQDRLGTTSGFVGYSLHEDPNDDSKLRHSGHLKINYFGFYPVIEASLDVNDRDAYQYTNRIVKYKGNQYRRTYKSIGDTPYVKSKLRLYIPLDFTSGGWSKGLIPQVNYEISNDRYNNAKVHYDYEGCFLDATPTDSRYGAFPTITGYESGPNSLMQKLTISVRGYSVLKTADSQVYPSWGIGAEAGYNARPGMTASFTPAAYLYLYGYVPGLSQVQGLKLTGMFQQQFHTSGHLRENYIQTAPRGFSDMTSAKNYLEDNYPWQMKFSADYAIPVWLGDWSFLCPVVYVRNFVLTPNFDYSVYRDGGLFSAGCTFGVHLANFFWLPYDSTFGIVAQFNGGSMYQKLEDAGCKMENSYVGVTFNISM
jgi:hypothetical protein